MVIILLRLRVIGLSTGRGLFSEDDNHWPSTLQNLVNAMADLRKIFQLASFSATFSARMIIAFSQTWPIFSRFFKSVAFSARNLVNRLPNFCSDLARLADLVEISSENLVNRLCSFFAFVANSCSACCALNPGDL